MSIEETCFAAWSIHLVTLDIALNGSQCVYNNNNIKQSNSHNRKMHVQNVRSLHATLD